ncbi:MAG TPA: DUF5652 family protein [Patescibacteria group bacterium]|nr:DUF5652 family protein [Patescibacteria group bacterium]
MHLQNYFGSYANPYNIKFLGPIIAIVIVWSFIWKALALWRAARNGAKVWYIVLLIVNTLGILEILYLYVFSKRKATLPPPTQM